MADQVTHELFGELRSAAQEGGEEGWARAVEVIGRWADEATFVEQALPYLREAFKDSAQTRLAPASWASEQGWHPAAALATGVDLAGSALDDEALAARLADYPGAALRVVKLDRTHAAHDALTALVGRADAATLHTLSLAGAQSAGGPLGQLAEGGQLNALSGLKALDLSNMGWHIHELEPFFRDSPVFRGLESVQLQGNLADHRDDLWHAFYDFMESTDEYGLDDYDGDYEDEDGEDSEDGEAGEVDPNVVRLSKLRLSVESQVVDWAMDITDEDGPYMETFHDLME